MNQITTAPATPRHVECTAEEYHQRPEVSQSQLKDFRKSPGLYHGRYVTKTIPPKSSSAMDLGTVVHAALLDPVGLIGVVAEIPADVLNSQGHRKGKEWTNWSEAHAGKVQMTPRELRPVRAMLDGVRAEPRAVELLRPEEGNPISELSGGLGHNEYSIVWPDIATGLILRARLDRWTVLDGRGVVADVKTCRAIEEWLFRRDAHDYGYWNQAAWYLDAAAALKLAADDFRVIVSCSTPPYECTVYQYAATDIAEAREENCESLAELADRRARDDWRPRHHGQVRTLERPAYAKRSVKLTHKGKEIVL